MLRFFRGPARLIEIPVGCASPQALHTAKTSYLGTMVPCRDTLPALPLCFSRSEMSRSIAYLLPIVDDCLHLIGFRNQPAVVTIQTIGPSRRSVLRMIINPTAWQVRGHDLSHRTWPGRKAKSRGNLPRNASTSSGSGRRGPQDALPKDRQSVYTKRSKANLLGADFVDCQ
jgi:hypothetical protein